MNDLDSTSRGEDLERLMDKVARQVQYRAFATAPKPRPTNANENGTLARLMVTSAQEIMGNPADAREIVELTFPNLALTPDDVPEGAVAPDPVFSFLLALKKALNEIPN